MIIELGKFLRKLRIEEGQRLADMSAVIGVSSAFLSAIERGKKSPPVTFECKVAENYKLDQEQLSIFEALVRKARTKIELEPPTETGRDTIGLLARKMNGLSDDQLEEIKKILQG